MYEEGKRCLQKAYEKIDQIPSSHIRIKLEDMHALITEGPLGRIKYLKQLPNFDDQDPHNYSDLGNVYNELGQYNNAIPELKKALDIYKNWDTKPYYINQYTWLGLAYHETGQYRLERKIYRKAEKDFPGEPALIYRQAVMSLTEGKMDAANEYIEKYKSSRTNNSWSESRIIASVASIYYEAGILDKAEEYYREALSLQPSAGRLNTLAYFLIDNDRNITEGL
jgi:tetratricopeptide (TPR) repeat protein